MFERVAASYTQMRIVSWNVENLVRWLTAREELLAQVHALGDPDVLCLQEIRIRPGDADDIAAMRALLPGYTCHFALANDARNVRFRGGRAHGVATYSRVTGTSRALPPTSRRACAPKSRMQRHAPS